METSTRRWLPGFIALGIIWGCSFLLIKVSLDGFTVLGVGVGRQLLGAVALVVWTLATRARWVTNWAVLRHLIVFAALMNAVPGVLFAWGETLVSSSLAGILNATTPLMTTLAILLLFRGERLSNSQIIGLVLGFFGVVVLSGQLFAAEALNVTGVLILLSATACYGIGLPYGRRFLANTGYSSTSIATAQVSLAALMLLPAAVAFPMVKLPLAEMGVSTILSLVLLGAVGTGLAYILNFRNIERAGSAIASTVTYFSPVVAVVAGWIVLGEELHWYVLAGAAIIVVSAALVQQRLRLNWLERR